MGLKINDLKDTIISRLSIDEFEPKTGDIEDVIVLGFRVIEQAVGKDLYGFLGSSFIKARDLEVSPNPNDENYFFVFAEFDRNEEVVEKIRNLVKEVENVSGKLNWKATTHLTDEFLPLDSEELEQYIITDPDKYMTKDEMEKKEEEEMHMEQLERNQSIQDFFVESSLGNVVVENDRLELVRGKQTVELEIVEFGPGKETMKTVGINESALKPLDSVFRMFNQMLGEMKAVPIDDYVVIYHPNNGENVLVTKRC